MFVGRQEQMEALSQLWGKRTSSLVTCRGRRRIGKSTLIEEFARRTADNFINIVGLPPRKGMTDRAQRKNFCMELSDQTGSEIAMAKNWTAAFKALDDAMPARGRTVVLLDEISWMGSRNPDFAGYLKTAWDKRLKKHDNLVLVLCGSVSSWIAENILDSTGFVGRDTLDIEVCELSLAESVSMFGLAGERLNLQMAEDTIVDYGKLVQLIALEGGHMLLQILKDLTTRENLLGRDTTHEGTGGLGSDDSRDGLCHDRSDVRGILQDVAYTLPGTAVRGLIQTGIGTFPRVGILVQPERVLTDELFDTGVHAHLVSPEEPFLNRGTEGNHIEAAYQSRIQIRELVLVTGVNGADDAASFGKLTSGEGAVQGQVHNGLEDLRAGTVQVGQEQNDGFPVQREPVGRHEIRLTSCLVAVRDTN